MKIYWIFPLAIVLGACQAQPKSAQQADGGGAGMADGIDDEWTTDAYTLAINYYSCQPGGTCTEEQKCEGMLPCSGGCAHYEGCFCIGGVWQCPSVCTAPCQDVTMQEVEPYVPPVCTGLGESECHSTPGCCAVSKKLADPLRCAGIGKPNLNPFIFLSCTDQFGGDSGLGNCAVDPTTGAAYDVFNSCAMDSVGYTSEELLNSPCCKGDCAPTPVGKLCVVPHSAGTSELTVGGGIRVVVWPKGCLSSSCTKVMQTGCSLSVSGQNVSVNTTFCFTDLSGVKISCTADCGGGGVATCAEAGTWTAGTHTVTADGLTVTVGVPSAIPAGGACTGTQF